MASSDEARRQFSGVNNGSRQGSATPFPNVPTFNPSARVPYGPGLSTSGPDSYPAWAQELMVTLDPRASRASSVFSTRTITSISTDHNESSNSNDGIYAGGRHWGGHSGYVPPDHTQSAQTFYGDATPGLQRHPDGHRLLSPQVIAARDFTGPELHPTQAELAVPDMDLPLSDNAVGVSRNPSFTPGKETISVKKHNKSSSVSSVTSASRTVSPGSPSYPPLRRSGGIKLRVVTTPGQTANDSSPMSPGSDMWSRSSDSRLPSAEPDAEPQSPAYFGKGSTGTFPSSEDLGGKIPRTPELSPRSVRAREPSSGRNERLFHRPVSPGTTQHLRTEPVPHDSGIALSRDSTPQSMVLNSPVQIDEAVVGVQPPPAMDSENDLSIHYSRIVRTLDQSHQKEMQEREEVIRGLARTILDLKTELVRAQHQVRIVKSPVPVLRKEDTPEAKSFSFPPLKLRHVSTLRRAIERRAEKLSLKSNSNSHPEKHYAALASASGDRDLNPAPGIDPNPNLQAENEGLKGMLCASQAKIESLELELRELRESLMIWTNRPGNTRPQQQDDTEDEHKKAIEHTREEVNKKWESRWKMDHEQLLDRMRRIENESQRLIKSAVEERDEEWAVTWAKKNAYLLTRLKDKEVEIKELKSAEARKEEGHEAQIKALEKRLAAEEHHTSILQEMLLGLETQHAKTKSELQDLRSKGRVPNQIPSLSP
ncbi:hypothetical protein FGG08_005943 [Glutinoglossum americanum]|uniref:Uncharacterized protein n=1 Tax=Glutinoglossum americanum TaxID=1670608 RepID=A0A9P8HTK6_9PEZI|nr:hypothetical protein FGG08_005943 [Glutinoglossum americanum]